MVVFDGTDWQDVTASQIQNANLIGLGMNADTSTPFAAKLNAALWSALYSADGGTGSLIQTLNRETGSNDVGFVSAGQFPDTRASWGFSATSKLRFSVTAGRGYISTTR